MSSLKDLSGMRFGRLTVIERAENLTHHTRWKCQCDCGNTTLSTPYHLISGRTQSCGCKNKEDLSRAVTKHGGAHSDLYRVWCQMKKRCCNKNYEHYDRYGGRGITVCQEWINDFAIFRDWAHLNGYEAELEIDRIDNDKGYYPENCKWSTRTEQVSNRSNTIFIVHGKETRTLIEWCSIFNIKYKLAHARYRKGWSFEKIFNI